MARIKLIWDFRGPTSEGTAKHHVVHLEQFAKLKALENSDCGYWKANELYAVAYITVDEKDMIMVRDALRPHRGETA